MLAAFEIVVVRDDYGDADARGARGYIIGAVTSDQIGVYLYDQQRVWCLHPDDVIPTGVIDTIARDEPKGAPLRVSSNGEVLG